MKNKSKLIIKITIVICGVMLAVVTAIAICSGYRSDTATCDEAGAYSLVAENAAEEIEFLSQFGLSVASESRRSEKITIPTDFSAVYEDYNALQNQIGLDLEHFKGETADKVTYTLNSGEYVVILVCRGRVIGGHITNGEFGSENRPLV